MDREITEEYLEELRVICSINPSKAEKILRSIIQQNIVNKLLCKAYRYISIAYFFLKEENKELVYIKKAIEIATDIESKVRGYERLGGYHLNKLEYLNAYIYYSKVINLYEDNHLNIPDFLIYVKMNILILYRRIHSNLISNTIIEEIEDLIPKVEKPRMIANFYWIKGVWKLDKKAYEQALEQFEKSIEMFKSLGMEFEEMQVYPKIAIAMYKLGIEDYKFYNSKYIDYLKLQSIDLNNNFIYGIFRADINPFFFIDYKVHKYLNLIKCFKSQKNYECLYLLYQYFGEYYIKKKNEKAAFSAFKNYFKFKKLYEIESEEKTQIERIIKEETLKIIERKALKTTYKLPDQPNIIQEYVHQEIHERMHDHLTKGNEGIITELLVRDFQQKIPINTSDGTIFLEVSQVAMLQAEGSYVIFIDKDKKRYTTSRNLAHYQRILDPKIFLRIHHSYIINRNYLQKLYHGKAGKIVLTNGLEVEVSVRKSSSIKKILLEQ